MSSPGTRVLLLADTHGELDPRIAELAQDCTLAVHAGDVGANVVLETLAVAAGRVLAVCGNNDVPAKWLGDLADLAALPERLEVPLPGGILVVDGFPGNYDGAAGRGQVRVSFRVSLELAPQLG